MTESVIPETRTARGGAVAREREEQVTSAAPGSRVSVVDESPPVPSHRTASQTRSTSGHTYKVYPSGRPDAVEFTTATRRSGARRSCAG